MINDRILAHADLLVGIFWTRVGTPTGKAISGSIEEIEEHRRHGKPVMLYFSNTPVVPDSIDQSQYDELKRFKQWAKGEGLVAGYENRDDFRDQFRTQLQITLQNNPYLKNLMPESADARRERTATPTGGAGLSADARELLRAAVADDLGTIMIVRSLDGSVVQAGQQNFGGGRRETARWEAAVKQLREYGFILQTQVGHDADIFEVADAGYQLEETQP